MRNSYKRKARVRPKRKFEPIFFTGSLAVFEKARPGGGCGGKGALAAAREIRSNLCIEAVPIRKGAKITRRRPTDFRYTAEGFPFASCGARANAGFSLSK